MWERRRRLNRCSFREQDSFRERFDLIVVGEHTPEVCSAEVLRRLREQRNPAPCLVFRRGPRQPFEGEFLRALGASDVLDHGPMGELAHCIGSWASRLEMRERAATAV